MTIETRSVDRAVRNVVGRGRNDTTFLQPLDALTVAFRRDFGTGLEVIDEISVSVTEALGGVGIEAFVYTELAPDGNTLSAATGGPRVWVASRSGESPQPPPVPVHGGRIHWHPSHRAS